MTIPVIAATHTLASWPISLSPMKGVAINSDYVTQHYGTPRWTPSPLLCRYVTLARERPQTNTPQPADITTRADSPTNNRSSIHDRTQEPSQPDHRTSTGPQRPAVGARSAFPSAALARIQTRSAGTPRTPEAYKTIDQVMEDQKDLTAILHTLHQVANYKGTWSPAIDVPFDSASGRCTRQDGTRLKNQSDAPTYAAKPLPCTPGTSHPRRSRRERKRSGQPTMLPTPSSPQDGTATPSCGPTDQLRRANRLRKKSRYTGCRGRQAE